MNDEQDDAAADEDVDVTVEGADDESTDVAVDGESVKAAESPAKELVAKADEPGASVAGASASSDASAEATAKVAAAKVAAVAPGSPLSKFAGGPPPAAGKVPSPAGATTPKPGALQAPSTIAVEQAVAETSDAKAGPAETLPAPPDPSATEGSVVAAAPTSPVAPAPDGLNVVFAGMTSVGLVREHNEDNLVIADLSTKARVATAETVASRVTAGGMLFAVCDGMGGAAAGEVASQMAVDFIYSNMTTGNFAGDRDTLARHLVSVVERAGKEIFDTAQADRSRRGMGTTSTVAALIDKVLFVAQVGDSRAYILRNGILRLVTKDQSLVNQLIEAGHLTEEEAESFEHSNIILQALGTAEKVQVDLTFVELRQGDRLMMCSDGLSGLAHADAIAETMRTIGDPVACCTRLTEQANEGGGHDNITVIIADFTGGALTPPASGEVAAYNQYPLLPDGGGATAVSGQRGEAGSTTSEDAPDAGGGAWQWWAMGVVAILVGVAISWWWENKQAAMQGGDLRPVSDGVVLPSETPPAEARDEAPEPELVPIRISTDSSTGLLLVDGEPRGALADRAPRDLDLAPGLYRLELQIEGDVAVTQTVTVESGKPVDVSLNLPQGAAATEPGDDTPAAEPENAPTPVRKPRPDPDESVPAPVSPSPAPTKAAIPARVPEGTAVTKTSVTKTSGVATTGPTAPAVPAPAPRPQAPSAPAAN